jgi:hypothetical protein
MKYPEDPKVTLMEKIGELTAAQRSELLQLYAIERQDNQNSQTVDFAIIAAALTYVIASAAFLLGHCSHTGCGDLPPLVQLGSPVILIALLSFLVLSVAATLMRAKHLRCIEMLLGFEVAPGVILPSFHRDSSDIYEAKMDRVLQHVHRAVIAPPNRPNIRQFMAHRDTLQLVYVPLTLLAYVSTLLIAVGYTIGVLLPGPWAWSKIITMIIYLLALLVQAAGIVTPLLHPRFKTVFEVD